jgi:hypothetical protein
MWSQGEFLLEKLSVSEMLRYNAISQTIVPIKNNALETERNRSRSLIFTDPKKCNFLQYYAWVVLSVELTACLEFAGEIMNCLWHGSEFRHMCC